MPDQPKRSRPRGGRRQSSGEGSQLFRHIVSSMRNGVLAVHRNGTLALMNDEAYRIFSMSAQPDDVGRPFTDVLRTRADVVRVLTAAFELNHLPNRAELRLKELDRVIGYTLSLVRTTRSTDRRGRFQGPHYASSSSRSERSAIDWVCSADGGRHRPRG
jgi:PAS domain-containing protein